MLVKFRLTPISNFQVLVQKVVLLPELDQHVYNPVKHKFYASPIAKNVGLLSRFKSEFLLEPILPLPQFDKGHCSGLQLVWHQEISTVR